jgi:hypothetical protein
MNGTIITRIFGALALTAFIALLFPAAAAAEGGEEAKQLLVESVEAMGGMETATGWTTMIQKGILHQFQPGWGSLTADCTRHVKKPDRIRDERDFSAYDHPFFYNYYLNGDEAWMLVNMTVREHPRVTEAMQNMMRLIDGVAYYVEHTDTLFLVPEVADDSLFAGSSLDRVGIVDQGDTVYVDMSRETRFPVRRIDNGGTRHIIMSMYRETDGRTVPYHMQVFEQTGVTTEYLWDEIHYDVEIDDALFEEYRPVKMEQEEE